jgi:UDP-N-acetylmuramyl tripeptide synthase
MSFKKIVAISAGKLVRLLSRLTGRQGSDFPGRVALKLYPDILRELALTVSEEIYMVTGTNGKTTTTNMVAAILRQKGYSYLHNRAGANMLTGITAAFIETTNLWGNRKIEYALLETDEANIPLVLNHLTPKVILITNFFRDQLDRYGELDQIITLIKTAIKDHSIELVLNGDDPLMKHFDQEDMQRWFFGFADTEYDTLSDIGNREGRYCIFCGEELAYERFHYAQLGKYHCPRCHNRNPAINFTAADLKMTPEISFSINQVDFSSPYKGFFNAYNILAAVSLAKLVGIEDHTVQAAIQGFKPQFGRMEDFSIRGKKVTLVLVKNPTGFEQVLSTLPYDPQSKNVMFILNDLAADGRDVSWIWDANLEAYHLTEEAHILHTICSGTRSGEIALRLRYAGFPPETIQVIDNIATGVETLLQGAGEQIYVLSTYTALFAARKILLHYAGV